MSSIIKGEIGPYPNYAAKCSEWYLDPQWQNMLVFPWMDEEAFQLCEVYTTLEMESVAARYGKKTFTTLKDYKELFRNLKHEGTRILIQGDPGIGKTAFTHKLALDWTLGELECFDAVFVLKLRYVEPNQSIPSIITEQILTLKDENVGEDMLRDYLKSGTHRVLLVLDGLDEIELEKCPDIKDVIKGAAYRKCCIITTTRPHMGRAVRNKMTQVANIRGFTLDRAKEYASHMIFNEGARNQFFKQLEKRNMSGIHKVPLMIQALALIFNEEGREELPETMTSTFDDLIFFLRKTCEGSKGLTHEDITNAMKEVNELAYRGLTRESRQLVFNRDEIGNPHVYQLGVLGGENAGSGFRPTAVLQFPHKAVQEYCAAGYVATQLESGNRRPWERIKEIYETYYDKDEDDDVQSYPIERETTLVGQVQHEEQGHNIQMVKTAITKIESELLSIFNKDEILLVLFQHLVDGGMYDDELDKPKMWRAFCNYHITSTDNLTEEEQSILFDYLMEIIFATSVEWRRTSLGWVTNLIRDSKRNTDSLSMHYPEVTQYAFGMQMAAGWIKNDPEMAKEKILNLVSIFQQEASLPYQSVEGEFAHIWEDVQSQRNLFSFLVGKLPEKTAEKILREIADASIKKSFEENTGEVLPMHLLETFTSDVIKESQIRRLDCNSVCMFEPGKEESLHNLAAPMILHLNGSGDYKCYKSNEDTVVKHHALKLSGGFKATEDKKKYIAHLALWISQVQHLRLVEIKGLGFEYTVEETKEFVETLFKVPVSSLEVKQSSPNLIEQLAKSLPKSVQRFSVSGCNLRTIELPLEVQLKVLYLEGVVNQKAELFRSHFPALRKLCLLNVLQRNSNPWQPEEIDSLLLAVREGRLPLLEDLVLCCGALQGYGKQLTKIISKSKNLKHVNFMATNLSHTDGQEIMDAMKAGSLTSILSINLLHCPGLSAFSDVLKAECQSRQIDLQISPGSPANESEVSESPASGLMNMVSAFMPLISQVVGPGQMTSNFAVTGGGHIQPPAHAAQSQAQVPDLAFTPSQIQNKSYQQFDDGTRNLLNFGDVISSIFPQVVQSDSAQAANASGKRNESHKEPEVPAKMAKKSEPEPEVNDDIDLD